MFSVSMLRRFSGVPFFVTLWTIACQAPLFMGFSRQEYWSGLPCPPAGDLPSPVIKPESRMSPSLGGTLFTTSTTRYYQIYKVEKSSSVKFILNSLHL